MAQIQKGTTYATGTQVTADNLNAHVDSAILLPGAITDQTAGTASGTDLVLVSKSGVLNKVTAASLAGLVDTASFLRTDGSAAMATGQQLTLGTTNQIAALNAASKGYVDSVAATRLSLTGGTLTGNLSLTTAGIVTLSQDPIGALDAATKQYVDATRSYQCMGYWSSTTNLNPISNVLDESKFISCTATRSASSSTLTVNFSALDARYKSSVTPFFLAEQYIGIKTVSGVTARLYKINSVDYANSTFAITTPETTAFSNSIQLSCVYDNSANTDTTTFNCKSVYMDYSCTSKYYVNYWNDTVTKSKTNTSPTQLFNVNVSGQSNTGAASGYFDCRLMIYMYLRGSYQFNVNVAEGFGAYSTGCHIGYFYSYNAGKDYAYDWRANFLIT